MNKLWLFIWIHFIPYVAIANIDSLQQVISSSEGLTRIQAIKSVIHLKQNSPDSILFIWCEKGLEWSADNEQLDLQASFNRLKGSLLMASGNYDSAKPFLEKALLIATQHDIELEIGHSQGVLGSLHYRIQDSEMAIEYWIPTLRFLKTNNYLYSFGIRLTQIGNAYLELGDTKTGIKYNKQALEVDEISSKPGLRARVYNSLGYGFDELQQFDSALYYYNLAYKVGVEQEDNYRMAISKINMCSAYESMNQTREAKACLSSTIDMLKKVDLKEYLPHVYTTMLNLQLNGAEYKSSLNTIDSIKRYLNLFPDQNLINDLPKMESMANEGLGNYKMALQQFKKYSKLKDSLNEASKYAQVEELRIKYETELKDQKIVEMNNLNELKDARNSRNQFLWAMLFLGSSLIFVLVLFALNRRYLLKKKQLAENEVKHQLEVLTATIQGQEEERKRIAQELHDGIGQQISAIKFYHESISEKLSEQENKMGFLLEQTANDIRSLSHQMMPKVLQEIGLDAALNELVNSIGENTDIKFNYTSSGYSKRLTAIVEVNIYRICQELLNNALKHSKASEVDVLFYKSEGSMFLVVSDNGVGATSFSNDGHGLLNIKSRAKAIKSNYFFETEHDKGFSFTLSTPIA